MTDEYERRRELEDRTIEALLLGFRKPIYRDYTLPCSSEVEQAVGVALARVCGIDKKDMWRISCDGIVWDLHHPERVQEKVKRGLQATFSGCRDENNALDMYMTTLQKLDWEWFYLIGDVFKFRPGDRERAEERVLAYWNAAELGDFEVINGIARRVINRVYKQKAGRSGAGCSSVK